MSQSTGEILEAFRNDSTFRFEWRIPKVSSLREVLPQYFHSPLIEISGTTWGMKLYGCMEDRIGLNVSRNIAKSLILTVGIRWADGSEEIFIRDRSASRMESILHLGEFQQRRNSQLDTLIISCTLWDDLNAVEKRPVAFETQTEELSDIVGGVHTKDVSTLQKHFQDLLLNGDDYDVTIKVGNQQFRAHKNVLRARSPVFSAMFKHKMKESEDGSISIDDCDPDVFGEFLKYVYTGKTEDLSPSKAVGLYYAADKYDFSGLKEICAKFLETSLTKTAICDVIALATYHGETALLECAMNFFSKHTKEILITVEWERFAKNNFTIANELYIKVLDSFAKSDE